MGAAALVTRSLRLHAVTDGGETVSVGAAFSFDPSDPYAVSVAFDVPDAAPVPWMFGRDLLASGLEEATGHGDVTIWPSTSRGLPVVCFALSSPSGRALLQTSRADVESFLAASYLLVPRGLESAHLRLDAVVDRLLAG